LKEGLLFHVHVRFPGHHELPSGAFRLLQVHFNNIINSSAYILNATMEEEHPLIEKANEPASLAPLLAESDNTKDTQSQDIGDDLPLDHTNDVVADCDSSSAVAVAAEGQGKGNGKDKGGLDLLALAAGTDKNDKNGAPQLDKVVNGDDSSEYIRPRRGAARSSKSRVAGEQVSRGTAIPTTTSTTKTTTATTTSAATATTTVVDKEPMDATDDTTSITSSTQPFDAITTSETCKRRVEFASSNVVQNQREPKRSRTNVTLPGASAATTTIPTTWTTIPSTETETTSFFHSELGPAVAMGDTPKQLPVQPEMWETGRLKVTRLPRENPVPLTKCKESKRCRFPGGCSRKVQSLGRCIAHGQYIHTNETSCVHTLIILLFVLFLAVLHFVKDDYHSIK
jgi:hypothetical protein